MDDVSLMNDETDNATKKGVENPWNELKPSEREPGDGKGASAPASSQQKPAKAFPPGTYGELNYKDEESPKGEEQADGSPS